MEKLLTQMFAYALVSAVALAADTGILVMLTRVGWHYLPASAASFAVGAVVAYVLSVRFVFSVHRLHNRTLEFGYFVALGLAGLAVNSVAMAIAVELLGLSIIAAKALAACCTFTTNFVLRRQLLFRAGAIPG
jgi:putative flippase GtrA